MGGKGGPNVDRLPSSASIKSMIRGRAAVVGIEYPGIPGALHALAWKDDRPIDCRADNPQELRIEDVTVLACAVFTTA